MAADVTQGLESRLAVAHAEKRLLSELSTRLQQSQLEERATHQATRDELLPKLHAAEAALDASRERCTALEAERQALGERCAHTDSLRQHLQGEHAAMSTERRQLDETLRRQV